MKRGQSKAKILKRGGRIRSAPTKAKTRNGRKDASATGSAKKLAAKLRAHREASASPDEIATLKRALAEAHERETATADVLQVISSSPGDLDALFRTMLENATRLCEAKFGTLFRYDGEKMHRLAGVGTPASLTEFQRKRGPFVPDGAPMAEFVSTKRPVMCDDEAARPKPGVAATYGGARCTLYVPLLKDGQVVGIFVIYRQEVRPFTDKQIELVSNFAKQAVIAIENARLLNELRELLEQQTATSEVLSVISSSPSELQPVFDKMLENATRICGAKFGHLALWEGDAVRYVAGHGLPAAYEEFRRSGSLQPYAKGGIARLLATRQPVHITDLSATQPYIDRDPIAVAAVELGGVNTLLLIPMLKGGEVIGYLAMCRQEVRPFTDKQIELVENFADQAVIAIENARLFNEVARTRSDDAGAADRDLGGAAGHQQLARRSAAGVRSSPGQCNAAL